MLNAADCRSTILILLLRSNRIVPYGTVREIELQIFPDVEASPSCARSTHFHVHDAVGEALPIGAVLHKEVDYAKLPLRYTIAMRIGIVANPVRLRCRKTNAYASLRSHTAVRDDIALKDGTVLSCTVGEAVGTLCDIEVDGAVVFCNEFAVGTDRCPGTASCADGATADVDT